MSAARDVAFALAGQRAQRLADGSFLVPCPVPSHGKGRGDRNPSLCIGDGERRLLVHCFGGCDPHDVLDALRRRGLLNGQYESNRRPVAAQNGDQRKREEEERAQRIKRARKIWHAARDPRGTLVEDYLRSRRLILDDDLAGHVLRFHPRCPWRDGFLPALIAVFRSLDDNAITAIHRIRLDQPERWPKAERLMLGPVGGAAVKLDSDGGDALVIGEGVETCMAARQLMATGELERAPVWALGNAGAIAQFPVLPNIRTLRILAENCPVNEDAREQCGLRWHAAGCRVRVIKPDLGFSDLNDVLGRNIP
jgi:hypothetical protein